jgi:hypothetical protein
VNRIRLPLLGSLLALALIALPGSASASAVSLTVKPTKALDGSSITVTASHLQPNHYYTFMLVGPKAKKDRALLGLGRADVHGRVNTLLKMPVILHCGKSTVYLFDSKHVLAHAPVTITGCTLKKGPGAPPPAPPKRK